MSESVNSEILQLHEIGMPHPDIGRRFGVSRERVRQIVLKMGAEPRTKQLDKTWDDILLDAKSRSLSYLQVAIEQGCKESNVRSRAALHGVKLSFRSAEDRAKLKRGAGHVVMGKSFYEAASLVSVSVGKLQGYCRKIGVKSKHPPKNKKRAEHPSATSSEVV